jgi:hypothetical protein
MKVGVSGTSLPGVFDSGDLTSFQALDAKGTAWNDAAHLPVNGNRTVAVVKWIDAANHAVRIEPQSIFQLMPAAVVEIFADGGDITVMPPSSANVLPGVFFGGSGSIAIPAGSGRRFICLIEKWAVIS